VESISETLDFSAIAAHADEIARVKSLQLS
jgi:hypothetical protein